MARANSPLLLWQASPTGQVKSEAANPEVLVKSGQTVQRSDPEGAGGELAGYFSLSPALCIVC